MSSSVVHINNNIRPLHVDRKTYNLRSSISIHAIHRILHVLMIILFYFMRVYVCSAHHTVCNELYIYISNFLFIKYIQYLCTYICNM